MILSEFFAIRTLPVALAVFAFAALCVLNAVPAVVAMVKSRRAARVIRTKTDVRGTVAIYLLYYGMCLLCIYLLSQESVDALRFVLGVALFSSGIGLRTAGLWALGSLYNGSIVVSEQQRLVTSGIYRYMRHPLHAGIVLHVAGMVALVPNVAVVLLGGVLTVVLVQRNRLEDEVLAEELSEAASYQRTVPSFGLRIRGARRGFELAD